MNKIQIILILTIVIYGCTPINDLDYFNGSINTVDINKKMIKRVNLKEIAIDLPLYDLYIYDSLIINNVNNNNYQYNIININSGEKIGSFCHKGRAKHEIIATTPMSHVYKENGDLKTIIIEPTKKSLFKWNITKSINSKTTVFDTIIPFQSLSKNNLFYDYSEYVNDSTLFTYTQSYLLNKHNKKPLLPIMEFRTISKDILYKDLHVFKEVFDNNKSSTEQLPSYRFYSSRTSLRPDRLFVAQSMLYLGQLNIINVVSGEIKGIRIKGTPDFSIFNTPKKIKNFYFCGGLWTTNDRIYVGYSGREEKKLGNIRYMYEFDWNGNIMNIYDIGSDMDKIIYDKANKIFYCMRFSDEKLFKLKLN